MFANVRKFSKPRTKNEGLAPAGANPSVKLIVALMTSKFKAQSMPLGASNHLFFAWRTRGARIARVGSGNGIH